MLTKEKVLFTMKKLNAECPQLIDEESLSNHPALEGIDSKEILLTLDGILKKNFEYIEHPNHEDLLVALTMGFFLGFKCGQNEAMEEMLSLQFDG